jgi:Cdc6-like AAA superfamily ATPase
MCSVELSHEEMEILSEVLQSSLATLELEIQHTDHQEFKNLLKHRRESLRTLIAKVPRPMPAAA